MSLFIASPRARTAAEGQGASFEVSSQETVFEGPGA